MDKKFKWLRSALFLFLMYLLFFLPLPFYLESPGSIFSIDEMIEIEEETADLPGEFYLTTVGLRQVTPATIIQSVLPYHELINEEDLLGDLDNIENYDRIQQYYMKSSINQAIKAAFDAAEKDYDFDYQGVYVLEITKESDFLESLEVGDLIQAVDGRQFESSAALIDYIANQEIGERVELEIKRETEELLLTGELIELESGKSGVGVGLVDNTEIITDPEVTIQAADIGGPSAGLMFSLELYTQLIEEDIRSPYRIAGTGTIGPDGEVGRIGGVDKKVITADSEEIDYFFVPDDDLSADQLNGNDNQSNYDLAVQTAEAIDSKMTIVPVKTMQDAIIFLEQLSSQKTKIQTNKIGDMIEINQPVLFVANE